MASATSLVAQLQRREALLKEIPVLLAEQRKAMKATPPPSWEFAIAIDFLDGLEQRKKTISVARNEQGNLVFLPPKEIFLTDV